MDIGDKLAEKLKKIKQGIDHYLAPQTSTIVINGESFTITGKNIVIKKDSVYVDENLIKTGLTGDVKIIFEGDVASLSCSNAVINGSIYGEVNAADIQCSGNISGDVNCTDIICGNVDGDIKAANINCENVSGNIIATSVKMNDKK